MCSLQKTSDQIFHGKHIMQDEQKCPAKRFRQFRMWQF